MSPSWRLASEVALGLRSGARARCRLKLLCEWMSLHCLR